MNLYADFKVLDATLKSLSGKDEAVRVKYVCISIALASYFLSRQLF
jgi:hypothetical protein